MTSTTRFSLCQLAVPDQTFEEDVALARDLGIGLGLDHDKLGDDPGDDDRLIELMRENGVAATICVAQPMTILPSDYVPDPADVDERMSRIKDGIRRLARFDPHTVFVITGPEGAYGREARGMVDRAAARAQGRRRRGGRQALAGADARGEPRLVQHAGQHGRDRRA